MRPEAQQLFTTSADGYTMGTPLDVLLEPDRGALLAVAMNDEPLPDEHGFPVRTVVSGLYGQVSATCNRSCQFAALVIAPTQPVRHVVRRSYWRRRPQYRSEQAHY
ncbi:hypothetical protein GCM10011581_38860 [Saccharopolyspora subtropica]|uniref:Oxidoreductase molybdopterin-binding domain-containing protein n=1 Tax=Saccharopolyspora thermophila TaxID=89367 RepID=A0A917K2U8_9PSEU|nr:hypothetical protein GCM10011581_38860 [Saccharopolyspora subtropica]